MAGVTQSTAPRNTRPLAQQSPTRKKIAAAAQEGHSGQSTISFNRDIRPIFSDTCFQCHGPDKGTRMAGLRLDIREEATKKTKSGVIPITPGKPEESEIIRRIFANDAAEVMPPVSAHKVLTLAQKETIKRWVAEGAKYEGHWTYQPLKRPVVPEIRNPQSAIRNPIDAFVQARLQKEGLHQSPEADRATLIRRVSLDLTGLPPEVAEVDAFLGDKSPNAYEKVVDRLLASPRYGERMAFRWLDAARYADTNGYQRDDERYMWRWRDWVIEAFNRNLPYDKFTIEQLAGDLLPNATLDQKIATGFNRNHRGNSEDGIVPEEYAVEYVVDRVDTTSTIFMGLTVACARCHDHKYDPLAQKEYYRLYAYFNSIPENGRATRLGNSPPFIAAPTLAQQQQLQQLEAQIAAAERRVAQHETPLQAAKGAWEKSLAGAQPQHWFPSENLVARFALDEAGERFKSGTPKIQPGRIDGAAEFDGKIFLDAGQVAKFDYEDKFTLSTWVYPTSEQGGAIITRAGDAVSQADQSAGARMGKGYGLLLEDGKVHFNLVNVWADDAIRVETENKLALNEWHHVLAIYNGSRLADGVQIYLDGQLQKLKINFDQLFRPFEAKEPLRIGGVGSSSVEQRFRGLIDEVRVYDAALSPSQIAVLASADSLNDSARIPPAQRRVAQTNKLLWAFLEQAAPQEVQESWKHLTELKQLKMQLEASFPTVMVMHEMEKPRDSFVLKRGAYDNPGEKVERGVPAVLPPMPEGFPNNRLGFANWLVHPSNPLTARVTVNRFWQMIFGTGLVKTIEDFGAQGEWPSHPELLDWLAIEFQSNGWNTKALLKTMVMSHTYRQSSKADARLLHRDPENRLLAHGPRLRLPAEMIRDQALFVSGLLVEQRGGPSVKTYQPEGLWNDLVFNDTKYVQDKGDKLYRRSLYTFWKRTIAPPAMLTFDAATRDTCVVRESRTNTPLQALNLMNDVTYIEASRMLAERLLREGGKTAEERIRFAFRLATARWPSQSETGILLGNLNEQLEFFRERPAEAERLLSVGEKPSDERLSAGELAAYSAVASLILNLDETITKE
ncbi:MAG: DUF1553 domain-containing protein [Pyrinomonadaceae bacterium]|nr:DUF1553 domain-containing protein [Pyrinomonadaceae bacterium]